MFHKVLYAAEKLNRTDFHTSIMKVETFLNREILKTIYQIA